MFTFRAATESDADALAAMMREFYEHERIAFDEEESPAALARLLGDESLGRVWMIEAGGEAVGYVVLAFSFSLEFRGRDAFVDELYIRAAHRGRGAGREAIRFVTEACRALGVRALLLEVDHNNAAAQALYRKEGFLDRGNYLMAKVVSSS